MPSRRLEAEDCWAAIWLPSVWPRATKSSFEGAEATCRASLARSARVGPASTDAWIAAVRSSSSVDRSVRSLVCWPSANATWAWET